MRRSQNPHNFKNVLKTLKNVHKSSRHCKKHKTKIFPIITLKQFFILLCGKKGFGEFHPIYVNCPQLCGLGLRQLDLIYFIFLFWQGRIIFRCYLPFQPPPRLRHPLKNWFLVVTRGKKIVRIWIRGPYYSQNSWFSRSQNNFLPPFVKKMPPIKKKFSNSSNTLAPNAPN